MPPPASKLYEDNLGLPDDANKLFLPDEAYLRWPLPAGEEAYASVDGMAPVPKVTAAIAGLVDSSGNGPGAGRERPKRQRKSVVGTG